MSVCPLFPVTFQCLSLIIKECLLNTAASLVSVSIARRLQNPLVELVKIEPKHLGIGMYQVCLGRKDGTMLLLLYKRHKVSP